MMRVKLVCCLSLVLAFLSGCFEIVEDVRLNADGSGTITYIVNMSQSRVKLNSIMLLDSVNGYPVPSEGEIRREIKKFRDGLSQHQGVTFVGETIDMDDYVFRLTFSFTELADLDEAMRDMGPYYNPALAKSNERHFEWKGSTFHRHYDFRKTPEMERLMKKEGEALEGANFVGIYRFATPISTFTNPFAKKSKDGTSVMIRMPIKDILSEEKSIRNQITLEP